MKRMPTMLAGAAGVSAAALVLTGCGTSDGGPSGDVVVDGTYVVAIGTDPGSLSPLTSTLSVTEDFNLWTYDSLLAPGADGGYVSNLATEWEVEPTSVTFTITPDATCDNGEPLLASDVAANFEWIKDPANESPVIGGQIPNRDFSVESDDEAGTVTVSVEEPYGLLLDGFASRPIVCPDGLADPESLNQGSAGTGPYILEDSVPGSEYTLTRREGYTWGPGGATTTEAGAPQTVIIRVVTDPTTAANQLLQGELNDTMIGTTDYDRVQAAGLFEIKTPRNNGVLVFNRGTGHATADPAVRRALDLATDKDELTNIVTGGMGDRATQFAVNEPRACTYDAVSGSAIPFDAEEAAQVLEDAGWVIGADGIREKDGQRLEIVIIDPGSTTAVKSASELLATQWNERLNAQVEVRPVSSGSFVDAIFKGDEWDVTWFASNSNLPSTFVPRFSGPHNSEGGLNYARVDNPEYDALVAQAIVTPGEEGCDLWRQAEEAIVSASDLIMVSMIYDTRFIAGATANELGQPATIRIQAG